jgi:hypothetical protein
LIIGTPHILHNLIILIYYYNKMSCKPYNNKWESEGYYGGPAPRAAETDMNAVMYTTQGDLVGADKTQRTKSIKAFAGQCKPSETWRVPQGACPSGCKNKLGSDDIMNMVTDVKYW